MLEAMHGRVLARPHPRTRGLIEIRNLGLIDLAYQDCVAVALVILLSKDAPRFIEGATPVERVGLTLPAIALWPDPAPPALKVEHALRRYALPSANAPKA